MNEIAVEALPVGTLLGAYRLEAAVAQGGFGILYRTWDTKLNRAVAMKECFPAALCHRDPQTGHVRPHREALRPQYDAALADAYDEAQTLAGLHHARVVPVYDVFRAGGSLFYVMPWLPGGSLRDKLAALRAGGPAVPEALAAQWLCEVLQALEYLHNRQILHRDIKPGNIMFDAESHPVLVDFGAALNRATKADTTTQGEFSPVYASPEQVSGKGKMGAWTDLYALAATWYELRSGSPPEPARQRMVADELQPLPQGNTLLNETIMHNLALQPQARCQSARAWHDWLMQGVAPPVPARRVRAARKWLLWAALAMFVALAYLVGAGSGTEPVGDAKPTPSAAQAPAQEKLYAAYCVHHADLLSQCRRRGDTARRQRSRARAEYEAALAALDARVQADMAAAAGAEARWNVYYAATAQAEKLLAEQSRRDADICAPMLDLLPRVQEIVYAPQMHYPQATAAELSLLPSLSERLTHELYSPYVELMYPFHSDNHYALLAAWQQLAEKQ